MTRDEIEKAARAYFGVFAPDWTEGNVVNFTRQQVELAATLHCRDCCCAQSWKALGVTQYTGKSIPDYITGLIQLTAELREENQRLAIEQQQTNEQNNRLIIQLAKLLSKEK